MPKHSFFMLTAMLCGFLASHDARAALDNEISTESLKGLGGVCILIENLAQQLEASDLSTDQLRTDVEVRLRVAGITVLNMDDCKRAPGAPILVVTMRALKEELGPITAIYAISVNVELTQKMLLERDPNVMIPLVGTWGVDGLITIAPNNVSFVRETLRDFVDKFANRYLTVNPKTTPGNSP
jgi:hypothetical protein